ncbi:MAG: LptE family protein [Flavobacteriales bacterium]
MKSQLTIMLSVILSLSACGIYSFSGASISSEIKTITIGYFDSQAELLPPDYPNFFTESMKDKFIAETALSPVNIDGDLSFSGYISNYSIKPIAIQANETAAKNRLTVSVKVTFTNRIQEEYNYDKTFSQYADYDSNQDLNTIESELLAEITDQLVENIFNEAVATW